MKKKIINFGLLPICVIGACVSGLLNMPKENLYSNLALENVEALSEQYEFVITCGRYSGKCWKQGTELKMCREYMYYECVFDGSPLQDCTNPC